MPRPATTLCIREQTFIDMILLHAYWRDAITQKCQFNWKRRFSSWHWCAAWVDASAGDERMNATRFHSRSSRIEPAYAYLPILFLFCQDDTSGLSLTYEHMKSRLITSFRGFSCLYYIDYIEYTEEMIIMNIYLYIHLKSQHKPRALRLVKVYEAVILTGWVMRCHCITALLSLYWLWDTEANFASAAIQL